jgi:tetratricopeptide (TPR) repeat protein
MKALHIFYSYAQEEQDCILKDELDKHLRALERNGQITSWSNRDIQAGTDWAKEIDEHLNRAQIILLLISPDFIASDYCYSVEMKRAMERYEHREAHVISILLRPVDVKETPFSKLRTLPSNGQSVTSWKNRDEAFANVAQGIRAVVERIHLQTKEYWLAQGHAHQKAGRYEYALEAHTYSLQLDHEYARAHGSMGDTLYHLGRYEEALAAYQQATSFDPHYVRVYRNTGDVLLHMGRYEEALVAYEHALRLEPEHAWTYDSQGCAFYRMKRYEEALAAYKRAIQIDAGIASFHIHQGNALSRLERFGEALVAYEQAILLDVADPIPYNNKGRALYHLGRYSEALAVLEQALLLHSQFRLAYRNRAEVLEHLGEIAAARVDRTSFSQLDK